MRYLFSALLLPATAFADDAVIEDANLRSNGSDWTVSVTLSHGDTGWDDYADGWRVLAPDGRVLGTRVLAHPHVTEQPFTRSLGGVEIPEDLDEIRVEASTSPESWGGEMVTIKLPR